MHQLYQQMDKFKDLKIIYLDLYQDYISKKKDPIISTRENIKPIHEHFNYKEDLTLLVQLNDIQMKTDQYYQKIKIINNGNDINANETQTKSLTKLLIKKSALLDSKMI